MLKGMRQELRLHKVVLVSLVMLLVAFVALMLRVRHTLADERLEAVAALILVVAAAAGLLAASSIEFGIALEFGKSHRWEMVLYLALGTLSLATGIWLGLSHKGTLQQIALAAAPQAGAFGMAQLRLGLGLPRHPVLRRMFLINGGIELLLCLSMLGVSWSSNEAVVEILSLAGCVAVLQVLPLLFYPHASRRNA